MDLEVTKPVVIESLKVELLNASALRLSGALNTETAQTEVSRVLTQVHARILAEKISSFTVDVRPLNFVNSSALRVFVNWISRAENGRYKLVFMTNPGTTWHRLSFSVLRSLAPQTVEIREGGGDGGKSS